MAERSRNEAKPGTSTLKNNKGGATGDGRKIKAQFIVTEEDQAAGYIANLEKNIVINKEILLELINSNSNIDTVSKEAMKKLNFENIQLYKQLKQCNYDRTQAQAKLLLSEQTKQDVLFTQNELSREYQQKVIDLEHEIDCQNFFLAEAETQFEAINKILQKYATSIPEIQEFLTQWSCPKLPGKFSDILAENKEIKSELYNFQQANEKLEITQHELQSKLEHMRLNFYELSLSGGVTSAETAGKTKNIVPQLDLTKVRRPGNKPIADVAYIHILEEDHKMLNVRIRELEEENRIYFQTNMQLKNTNSNLFRMNYELSSKLKLIELKESRKSSQGSKRLNKSYLVAQPIISDIAEPMRKHHDLSVHWVTDCSVEKPKAKRDSISIGKLETGANNKVSNTYNPIDRKSLASKKDF